jgi:hypothetical protein
VDRELPSQVYDVRKQGDVTSFRVVFPLDIPAHGEKRVGVYYGNPGAKKPAYESSIDLNIAEGCGYTIASPFYRISADPASGQISGLTMKTRRKEYTHPKPVLPPLGVLPGTGVVFPVEENGRLEGRWVSAADWKAPEIIRNEAGPLFFSITRRAPLPLPKDSAGKAAPVLTVTVTFPAEQPLILVESTLEFPEETGVFRIEGNGVRVNAEKFSHFTFRPVTGTFPETEVEEMGHVLIDPAFGKGMPEGNVLSGFLPLDLAWHAFIRIYKGSRANQYALTSINLECSAGGGKGVKPVMYRPASYLFREKGAVRAFRAPVYVNRQDRKENIVRIPAGSVYRFRDAVHMGMWDNENWAQEIEALGKALNNPLAVSAHPNLPGRKEPAETDAIFKTGLRKAAYLCAGVR